MRVVVWAVLIATSFRDSFWSRITFRRHSKFSRPRLVVSCAHETSLRPTKTSSNKASLFTSQSLLLFSAYLMRIMVWTIFVTATLWNRLRPFHHELATNGAICFFEMTVCTRWFGFDDVLTVWVVRTSIKDTEAATALFHFSFTTFVAGNTG